LRRPDCGFVAGKPAQQNFPKLAAFAPASTRREMWTIIHFAAIGRASGQA
jgi:hypothetical protein